MVTGIDGSRTQLKSERHAPLTTYYEALPTKRGGLYEPISVKGIGPLAMPTHNSIR